jgi:hypothetical protein
MQQEKNTGLAFDQGVESRQKGEETCSPAGDWFLLLLLVMHRPSSHGEEQTPAAEERLV